MAVIKYTGQKIKATLENLTSGHHLAYTYVKASVNSYITGLTTSFTGFKGSSTSDFAIPSLSSASSYTVTITAYAKWDNGNSGATCTNNVQIRQSTRFTYTIDKTDAWVGQSFNASYTLNTLSYVKGVQISASATIFSASGADKPASSSSESITLSPIKSGSSIVEFIPSNKVGDYSLGSKIVKAYQPVTEIIVNKTSATVNPGGSTTIYIKVAATNENDRSATEHIHHPYIYHKFSGSANGSTSTSASLEVKRNTDTSAGTALTLSNITKGGDLVIAAKSGLPTETTAAIASGSLSQTIKISIGSISFTFYSDSAYSKTKTDNKINAGDYFFVKVTGGQTTSNGTLSCTTSGITIETASISEQGGKSKVTVGSSVTGSFKLTFKPSNGAAVNSTSISIQAPTLTLS